MQIDYRKDWDTMAIPTVRDLQGEFDVTILSGICKTLVPFMGDWRKSINNRRGYNIVNNKKVGFFQLEYTDKLMNLEYSAYPEQKPKYWTRLRDEMRVAESGDFIGRIWFQDYWAPRFLGFFSLTRFAAISEEEVLRLSTWNTDFPALVMHVVQLWECTENSFIAHRADQVLAAVGLSARNAQIIEALKTNKEFWKCLTGYIDDPDFYVFELPIQNHLC